MVIFETVFTLERSYRGPKDEICQQRLAMLPLPGIVSPGRRRYARIFDLHVDNNLPFGDVYIVADMERPGATYIFGFDRESSRLLGMIRTEPSADAPDEDS